MEDFLLLKTFPEIMLDLLGLALDCLPHGALYKIFVTT